MDTKEKYSSVAACHYRKHVLDKEIPPMVDDFVMVDNSDEDQIAAHAEDLELSK